VRRFLLRPLVALLLAAVPALADSTVPALPAATSLTSAATYLSNGGANDNRVGFTTSLFTIVAGALTLANNGVTNAMLANASTTVNTQICTLGSSCTVTAAAGTLTGTTLNATVVNSSLTSVGTLTGLTMGGNIALGTNSLTGNFTATGVPILSGLSAGTQVSCLGLDAGNHVVLNAAACGSGGGSSAFSAITSGTNTAATMTVGAGGSLTFTSTGVVNANQLGGVALLGGTLTNTNFCTYASSGTLLNCNTGSTGSGSVVLATSPTLVTPNLGTPSAVTLTSGTGLPISTGVSGLGTGVATALGNAANATGGFGTVGTSGSNVGLLNANKTDSGANTFSGTNTFAGVNGGDNVQSGTTYTTVATDCGKTLVMTGTSPVITIAASIVPPSGTGCQINVLQAGTTKVSVNGSAVSAATLESTSGYTGTSGTQYSMITLHLTTISSTTYAILEGDGS